MVIHGDEGRTRAVWTSPANIALIKYLGKHGHQLPRNPSLSMTLTEARTTTSVRLEPRRGPGVSCELWLRGRPAPAFAARVQRYLASLLPELPYLAGAHAVVETENHMPHSTGLASSASAMSALALCLCSLDPDADPDDEGLRGRASRLARMGSGSAARSLFGGFSVWGVTPAIAGSSDEQAIPYPQGFHPRFAGLLDAIAVVSRTAKATSSSDGHALMDRHPLAAYRYQSARERLVRLLAALSTGVWRDFAELVETEALEVHGLMMAGPSPCIWMAGATLDAIQRIRGFRAETGAELCFTLDAGPNVHVLYPAAAAEVIEDFLDRQLRPLCVDGELIHDHMGPGPLRGAR